jgi:hypothetical protein
LKNLITLYTPPLTSYYWLWEHPSRKEMEKNV